jgi:hypothetical protein
MFFFSMDIFTFDSKDAIVRERRASKNRGASWRRGKGRGGG